MSLDHGHAHHHPPAHGSTGQNRAFAVSLVLNIGFVIVEVVYGVVAGSMALVADAAHNLGDVLGLLLAWGATRLARVEPCDRRTYGWRKTTVFAALLNAILIVLAVGGVAWEALGRLAAPPVVDGWTVMAVAAVGVLVNGVSAVLFFEGGKRDANLRGAFLHLAADAAVSAGVVVAGVLVVATGWLWIDPVTSLLISAVILVSTWALLRESTQLLLDAVPPHIDLGEVRERLRGIEGVQDVHDLHVWAMSTRETSLTAHVEVDEGADASAILRAVESMVADRFDIEHTTVQVETRATAAQCEQGRPGAL